MTRPDFLVIGHVVKDVVPGGWRLGGTAAYASLQAARLGLRAAVVTSAPGSMDLAAHLPGVQVHRVPSRRVTTFRNRYRNGDRTQFVLAQARALGLSDIPDVWRSTPIVLLGPVCGEVPPEAASVFPEALVGVSAQGWLRRVDAQQRVGSSPWPDSASWRDGHVLCVSAEDIAGDPGLLDRWTDIFPIIVCTESSRGTRLHVDRQWRHIDVFPQREVDPTGAGDVFATAFLVRLSETDDAALAARFGAAASSIAVSGEGALAIAERGQIEERMTQHPEIVLR
jgi:sugar/nucleoside kinase (ribokinase family)